MRLLLVPIASAIAAPIAACAEAAIAVTVEAPRAQPASVAGVAAEDFDSQPLGANSPLAPAVCTLARASMQVMNADPCGGAGGLGWGGRIPRAMRESRGGTRPAVR